MGYCVFNKSSDEILKSPVTLIQILAGKSITKIGNGGLMHSELRAQETNLGNLHCVKMFWWMVLWSGR